MAVWIWTHPWRCGDHVTTLDCKRSRHPLEFSNGAVDLDPFFSVDLDTSMGMWNSPFHRGVRRITCDHEQKNQAPSGHLCGGVDLESPEEYGSGPNHADVVIMEQPWTGMSLGMSLGISLGISLGKSLGMFLGISPED